MRVHLNCISAIIITKIHIFTSAKANNQMGGRGKQHWLEIIFHTKSNALKEAWNAVWLAQRIRG